MKKVFLIALLILAMIIISTACDEIKQASEKPKQKIDTVGNAKKIADSLKREAKKEQAQYAYDNIKFGTTKEEYNKIEKEKKLDKGITINGVNYDFYAKFNQEDSLYMVIITSEYLMSNYFDNKLREMVENLNDAIKEKYGEPYCYDLPKLYEMKPNMVRWMYEYEIDKKFIKIGISENSEGYEYNVYCEIYDREMKIRKLTKDFIKKNKNIKNEATKF